MQRLVEDLVASVTFARQSGLDLVLQAAYSSAEQTDMYTVVFFNSYWVLNSLYLTILLVFSFSHANLPSNLTRQIAFYCPEKTGTMPG